MHILIIPSWYPAPDNPIRGIFFLEQAQALQKAGHKIHVLVPPVLKSLKTLRKIQTFSNLKPELQIEIYQGLKTYRTSIWKWLPRSSHWINKYWVQRHGEKIFKTYLESEGKPDIIHAHSIFYGGYLAAQFAQKWQIPVVLTEHSSGFLKGIASSMRSFAVKECLEKTVGIIAVGPALKKVLQSYSPQREIKLIGNMVDVDFFKLSSALPPSPFIFCLVAFLTPKKGIDLLLQSFTKAFKDQKVILKIAGDGADRNSLMALAEKLKIAKQVDFMGLLPRKEIRNLLHRSHALVSSSYVETFGVNLIEAMACGKPVISTRSGGPEMFVNDRNGILTPTGDVNALAEAMQKMVETYEHYDSEQIRSECVNRFGEAAIVDQLEIIYQDALQTHEN